MYCFYDERINPKLKSYIEDNIFKENDKNEVAHNMEHVSSVISRSLIFAKEVDGINYDMVYTIAAYHDIGHHIDSKNHEKVSAKILEEDESLRSFFIQ